MTVNLRKIKNDKLVKYYFSLEAARWEDAAKSPNARKLYEYYCYKRQTNPWVVVSNVGLWEMRIKMHRETKANIIRKLVEAGLIEARIQGAGKTFEIRKINAKV